MREYFLQRILCFFVALLILLSCTVVASGAVDYDSVNIPPDEFSSVQESKKDIVVKLYNSSYMKGFSQGKSVEEMISTSLQTVYMVIEQPFKNNITYKAYYKDGKLYDLAFPTDWSEFYIYAISTDLVFDSSIKVNKVYCLDGEPSHNGVYIYYETNKGDYVLFKEYLTAEDTYLFPIEDFRDFAKAVCEENERNKGADGGEKNINEIYDLDSYVFHKRISWQGCIIIAGSIILVLITSFVIYTVIRKRKKAR